MSNLIEKHNSNLQDIFKHVKFNVERFDKSSTSILDLTAMWWLISDDTLYYSNKCVNMSNIYRSDLGDPMYLYDFDKSLSLLNVAVLDKSIFKGKDLTLVSFTNTAILPAAAAIPADKDKPAANPKPNRLFDAFFMHVLQLNRKLSSLN